MKKIFAIILFAFVVLTGSLQAQTKQYYSLGWDVGMPVGSFSDYISETSLRGGFFSGNIFVTDAVSIGFKFGYNSYHENTDRQTYYGKDGSAITAASYNYLVSSPMQLGGYYHFNLGSIEPYIGLGLGINYLSEETIIQDWDVSDDQWAFLVNPEIGLRIPISNTPLAIGVRAGYNFNVNKYEPLGVKYDNFQSVNLGLSLSWTVQ